MVSSFLLGMQGLAQQHHSSLLVLIEFMGQQQGLRRGLLPEPLG
jgi:hypothetical protein